MLPEEEQKERRLTYVFLNLTYEQRLRVALELRLIRNEDEGQTAGETWKHWLAQSREKGLFDRLCFLAAREYVWLQMEKAILAYPNDPDNLASELQYIQQSNEYRLWKDNK